MKAVGIENRELKVNPVISLTGYSEQKTPLQTGYRSPAIACRLLPSTHSQTAVGT